MKKHILKKIEKHFKSHTKKDILMLIGILFCIGIGVSILWVASFKLPDLTSFEQRKISESTKIYDRTGTILLFDLHDTIKRTVVTGDDISPFIKKMTVAIEDATFYEHKGIKPSSIIRAIFANLKSGGYSQGGSTITQQVIKNTVLTKDKTISRKLKEWVLALKLEKILSKDRILELYLNETTYGGNMYGVEEATQQYFGKKAKDVTLAEAAYLAAIPQASTYFSPYGKNLEALENRKNLVLEEALQNNLITQDEYTVAKAETVTFIPPAQYGIRAPHFVFFVKDYLEKALRLDEGTLDENGYRIISTLNMDLQEKAEIIVKNTALKNEKDFEAKNAALVAIDPKTGDILSMVGSRDYFDKEIDGEFNVAASPNRQPGSTMKPIVYAQAFIKGYTPETVLFDLETEFSTQCSPKSEPLTPTAVCYHPGNYDEKFRGPITLREALAQSINIPSIKLLYLTGIRDSINLAKSMGITSLNKPDSYGLTLVLGGGEISLLEMTNAYGVFANDGIKNPYRSVLQVFDSTGTEIKLPSQKPSRAMPENIARTISDILSDNTARTPAYGPNSVLYFPDRDVAVKTGTTNESVDAWTVGYSPNLVVGVWAGNNDNKPMVKKVAGQIVAPMWSSFMNEALNTLPNERFFDPTPEDSSTLKPVLKGIWQGGDEYVIDSVSGKLATTLTPQETRVQKAVNSVHSILYWIDKNNPRGPSPTDPSSDPQFERWETLVRAWAIDNGYADQDKSVIPTQTDDVHTEANKPVVSIQNIDTSGMYAISDSFFVPITSTGTYPLSKVLVYINGVFIETLETKPFMFKLNPQSIPNIQEINEIKVIGIDSVYNRAEASTLFKVKLD